MPAPIPLPPLDVLTALLAYDPDTGILTWRKKWGLREAGSEAGTIQRNGYVTVTVKRRHFMAHRIAYALHHGRDPYPLEVDHINRVCTDNRACNLRAVTGHQNRANSACADIPVEVTLSDGSMVSKGSLRAAARLIGCNIRTVRRRLDSGKPLTQQLGSVPAPIPVDVVFPDGRTLKAPSKGAAARLIGCHISTVRRRLADGQPLQSGHRVRFA